MASPEQRLRNLERSELFSRDFLKRRHWTHAQWAALSTDCRADPFRAIDAVNHTSGHFLDRLESAR